MRKVVVITQITLDGIRQAPGGPEEDPRGGFTQGGWIWPFADVTLGGVVGPNLVTRPTQSWRRKKLAAEDPGI